jgi:hypothetical protein
MNIDTQAFYSYSVISVMYASLMQVAKDFVPEL